MDLKLFSKRAARVFLAISICIFFCSVGSLLIFPSIYKYKLHREVSLSKGSTVEKIWEDIPLPIYEKLYFFNITNEDEFLKGAALNVSEVGPYIYKARWVKENLQWNPNGTVSYNELRTYHFVPELSTGSEEDEIYTLNGPLIIASDILKQYNTTFRSEASKLFTEFGETVITKKKIIELAYGGYEDDIIKWAIDFRPNIPYKDGRFLWMYDKNATYDGNFTVFTGEDDSSKTAIINSWNGLEKLDFWNGETCNSINGTSMETGPPLPETPETYTFFQTIFCRSLTFKYTGDRTNKGVDSIRFESTDKVFANGSDNPANECFDLKQGRASGVLDVSPCQFDAPVLMSFPHFHLADPSYLDSINGLSPRVEDHGSHFDVEPNIGISVDVRLRFQVNLEINRTEGVVQMDGVPEGVFPVFWVGIEVSLDDE